MSETAPPTKAVVSRLDRALRLACAVALAVILILTIAELVARRIFAPPLEPYTAHPLFHIVRTPHYKQRRLSIDQPPYWFDFEIDALGFRGKKMQTVEKPANTYRIFFVGASTTENQSLPEEKTFAGIVQARLDAALHGRPDVQVANCGVSGFGIARSLSLIEHRILALHPDLIVVLDVENDVMTSIDDRFDPTNASLTADEPNWREFIRRKSRLFAVLDAATSQKEVDPRHGPERRRAMARARPYYVPEGVALDRFLEGYKAYVRWIALVCRDANVPVAFLTQPTLWKEHCSKEEVDTMWMSCFPTGKNHLPPDVCARLMVEYNDALTETAKSMGALVVDAASAVPKDLAHFVDDAHMTAAGNAAVAEAVLGTILKDGRLPQRAAR